MTEPTYGPRTRAWAALREHAARLSRRTIASFFEAQPERSDSLCVESGGVWLDLSRQLLDVPGLKLLVELAEQTGVPVQIQRMLEGEPVNVTEDRAALHVALRRPADCPLETRGCNVMPLVEAERAKMRALAAALHDGRLKGYTGMPITDVVNIGIGGSDLGVAMAVEALHGYRKRSLGIHFISGIDGVQVSRVLEEVSPETTLFIVCSKSFTTLETLTNARAVRQWLAGHGADKAVAAQFVAVSTNHEAMDAFGIAADRRLALWDWVGGRYSIWSAVGLGLAMSVGWDHFESFLLGAHAQDEHFRSAPLARNLPVLLALAGIWNRNFLGAATHAVLPYDHHLNRLPAYLQQLEMESNGKSVRRNGEPVECETCPVIWGEAGSNAQHSFYQLLHQGTQRVSADFLVPVRSAVGQQDQQDLAAANCLAQVWALAVGDPDGPASIPFKRYPGNRPSSLIMFETLDPATLGRLIALYEHKVFVQGVIWDINSFDQWGVELGKRLASTLASADGASRTEHSVIAGARRRLDAWRG